MVPAVGSPPFSGEPQLSLRLAGAELEVAFAHDLAFDEVDQEGPSFTHHAVERQQVPDVQRPAHVPALAGRRPFGRLQVAEPGGAHPPLAA